MGTKRKSEIIIFWGFVILAISFFAMVFYFQLQSNKLNSKTIELNNKKTELDKKEAELEARYIQISELEKSNPNKEKVELIAKQTNEKIILEYKKLSKIFIQVGSETTKSKLVNMKFVSLLNSDSYNIINEFDIENENNTDNTIRFFNEDDKNLAIELSQDISKRFSINLKPIYIKSYNVNKGQLELWIK